ncbi:hypothetical protein ACP70R_012679 [Stipagrostis hirtigluma subsp. patula]
MLHSTLELITLWASSSPSLLAFCFSHLIIAVLFLGGRGCAPDIDDCLGECTPEAAQAETPHGVQVQGGGDNRGGQDDPTAAAAAVGIASCGRCAPDASVRADDECSAEVGEVDTSVQLQSSDNRGGEEEHLSDDALQDNCGDEDKGGEDELMMRAEEFIRRMNRAWRTEHVRVC